MTANLRIKLKADLYQALWRDLAPHAQRNAVFVVTGDVLLDVGEAVALNRTADVEKFLAGGQIARPSAEQMEGWALHPGKVFQCLIVQPYVFIRESDAPEVNDAGTSDVTIEDLAAFVRSRKPSDQQ
ncbi:MAG: DUF2288 family protein [Myxococcota bacterium]